MCGCGWVCECVWVCECALMEVKCSLDADQEDTSRF